MKYLEMGQALRAHGTFRLAGGIHQYDEAQYEVRHFFCIVYILIQKHHRYLMTPVWKKYRSKLRTIWLCSWWTNQV